MNVLDSPKCSYSTGLHRNDLVCLYPSCVADSYTRRPSTASRRAEIAAAETEAVRSDVVDMQPGAWLIDRM